MNKPEANLNAQTVKQLGNVQAPTTDRTKSPISLVLEWTPDHRIGEIRFRAVSGPYTYNVICDAEGCVWGWFKHHKPGSQERDETDWEECANIDDGKKFAQEHFNYEMEKKNSTQPSADFPEGKSGFVYLYHTATFTDLDVAMRVFHKWRGEGRHPFITQTVHGVDGNWTVGFPMSERVEGVDPLQLRSKKEPNTDF